MTALTDLITVPDGRIGVTRDETKEALRQIKRDVSWDADEFIDVNFEMFQEEYFKGADMAKEEPEWQDIADYGHDLAVDVMKTIYEFYVEGNDIYLLTK